MKDNGEREAISNLFRLETGWETPSSFYMYWNLRAGRERMVEVSGGREFQRQSATKEDGWRWKNTNAVFGLIKMYGSLEGV